MRTFKFLMALLLLAGSVMQAQVFLEDSATFDSGIPSNWTTVLNTGSCDWTTGSDMPAGPDFPTPAAVFNDFECGSGAEASNVALYSPIYNLADIPSVPIQFYYDLTFQEIGAGETLTLEVYTASMWELLRVYDTSEPKIVQEAWSGTSNEPEFQIRWTYDDAGGAWGMHGAIDNFNIEAHGLGIEDDKILGFKMSPNPANDIVSVRAQNEIQNVTFFNILGQKVLAVSPNALSQEINVATLKAGVYIVNVTADEQVGFYRLIKQ